EPHAVGSALHIPERHGGAHPAQPRAAGARHPSAALRPRRGAMRGQARCCCLLLAATLAACALSPVADPPVTQSLIEQLPAEVPRRPASAWTLLVLPPQARPAVDTTQMAYALHAHQLAYYARNQWAETPPQMLQPLLVRSLA